MSCSRARGREGGLGGGPSPRPRAVSAPWPQCWAPQAGELHLSAEPPHEVLKGTGAWEPGSPGRRHSRAVSRGRAGGVLLVWTSQGGAPGEGTTRSEPSCGPGRGGETDLLPRGRSDCFSFSGVSAGVRAQRARGNEVICEAEGDGDVRCHPLRRCEAGKEMPTVTARGQGGASAGKKRSGPKGLGDLPFLLLSKSKPRKRLCQQGTNELHTKQQKLPGGAGQEKPDFACTAE